MTKFVHSFENENLVNCPFCGEEEFDLMGLKNHFESGSCDVYNVIDISQLHTIF